MYLQTIFELSMVLDSEKFNKLLTKVYDQSEFFAKDEDEYIDKSLASKGITITYRDSQYKKKVKLIVNQGLLPDSGKPNPDKLVSEYFGCKYRMDDFNLTGMVLTADINVGNRGKVAAYLKVLQRIGTVKGFSPSNYDNLDNSNSFCLDGNSNGIVFLLYDLEELLTGQLRKADANQKKVKSMIEESKGILRAEVRLTKPKSIRAYTDKSCAPKQIAALSARNQEIFLDTFMKIIPYGCFHKKDKAVEIIRREVKDSALRRRMLRLFALIPEKKSLLLAQKEMNYRNIEKIMDAFAEINVSPVTISKRHDVKHLKSLYSYLFD